MLSLQLFYEIIFSFAISTLFSQFIKNTTETLININCSLFGIVFAVYTFILPYMSKMLEQETRKYKKLKNINQKFKIQGDVYDMKLYLNKMHTNMIIMINIFICSIFMNFNNFPNLIILFSLFFEFINILHFIRLVKLIYHYNISNLEEEMYKECVEGEIIEDYKKD